MRVARRLLLLSVTSLGSLLTAAASASAAEPSTSMTQINDLFWVVATLALIIGLFVGIVLVITVLKFRIRKGHTEPLPNLKSSNHSLEAAWTVVPAIILLVIGVMAFEVLTFTDTPCTSWNVQVTAIGHQWFWEFWTNYTNGSSNHTVGSNFTSANSTHSVGSLTIRSNMTVRLVVESVDVAHSLFIQAFGVHLDAIPGHANSICFEPTMPGSYTIVCTQFCGLSHYAMAGTVDITR